MASATSDTTDLALHGGEKTVDRFEGQSKPKVGLDEFLALAETWGYSQEARKRIKAILAEEEGTAAPHLTRYYNPRPSQVAALEAHARELFGSRYALAVNSGTSALNAAYVACGVGPGDEVIQIGRAHV